MELSLSLSRSSVAFWGGSSSESLAPRGRQHVRWRHPLWSFTSTRKMIQPELGQSLFVTLKQNKYKVLSYQNREIPVLEGRSIEDIYDALTDCLLSAAAKVHSHHSKYIVGLAGPPGAGKTTLASEVVNRLNTCWSEKKANVDSIAQPHDIATLLPMDGFHLYRSQLDALENPEEAHARRGAPWTFNADLFLKCLCTLRNQGSVYVPSFDHGVGDPVEDDIFVSVDHKIVIVEGNYLFLEEGAWKEVCSIFDEKWFLDIDIHSAMQRVLKRHISTGKEPDVAKWRVEYNDRPNAELITKSKKNADLIIRTFLPAPACTLLLKEAHIRTVLHDSCQRREGGPLH